MTWWINPLSRDSSWVKIPNSRKDGFGEAGRQCRTESGPLEMKNINGKTVLETAEEILAHTRPALLMVDVSNDFYHSEGAFGRTGQDLTKLQDSLEPLGTLLTAVRETAVSVVHIQNTVLPDGGSDSAAFLRFKTSASTVETPYSVEGTWGWDFLSGFEPHPGELVVQKYRPSAFVGTDLENLLREAGVETVVVAGCVTEGCVQATAVDALFRDLYTVVVEDSVASFQESLHNEGIRFLKRRVAIASSDVVCGALASKWLERPKVIVDDR